MDTKFLLSLRGTWGHRGDLGRRVFLHPESHPTSLVHLYKVSGAWVLQPEPGSAVSMPGLSGLLKLGKGEKAGRGGGIAHRVLRLAMPLKKEGTLPEKLFWLRSLQGRAQQEGAHQRHQRKQTPLMGPCSEGQGHTGPPVLQAMAHFGGGTWPKCECSEPLHPWCTLLCSGRQVFLDPESHPTWLVHL